MTYMKEYNLKLHALNSSYKITVMSSKNEQLMSMFNSLGIKCIYSNPYYPKGNSRIENVNNFLRHTIAKFTYDCQLEWDNALPLATFATT